MIELHVRKDSRQRLSSFYATGHAGWAESGEDIVCAAVSAVLQAAWLGLAEVRRIDVTGSRSGGRLELAWPHDARDDLGAQAIVATAVLSIERMAMQFPDHVRVIIEAADG